MKEFYAVVDKKSLNKGHLKPLTQKVCKVSIETSCSWIWFWTLIHSINVEQVSNKLSFELWNKDFRNNTIIQAASDRGQKSPTKLLRESFIVFLKNRQVIVSQIGSFFRFIWHLFRSKSTLCQICSLFTRSTLKMRSLIDLLKICEGQKNGSILAWLQHYLNSLQSLTCRIYVS